MTAFLRKDEQSGEALRKLSFGHPTDPEQLTGVSLTTLKELEKLGMVEFVISAGNGKELVRITAAGKQVYDWAAQRDRNK